MKIFCRHGRTCSGHPRLLPTAIFLLLVLTMSHAFAADAAFQAWLQSLWPQAQALGVSRATFDMATRGLEPDLSLPELVIPGRPERKEPGQPEFVRDARGLSERDRLSIDWPRRAASSTINTGRRSPRSSGSSASRRPSCWRSSAARPTTAAPATPTTPSACWRRRPITASARKNSATNFCWRSRCSTRATSSSPI